MAFSECLFQFISILAGIWERPLSTWWILCTQFDVICLIVIYQIPFKRCVLLSQFVARKYLYMCLWILQDYECDAGCPSNLARSFAIISKETDCFFIVIWAERHKIPF